MSRKLITLTASILVDPDAGTTDLHVDFFKFPPAIVMAGEGLDVRVFNAQVFPVSEPETGISDGGGGFRPPPSVPHLVH